MMKTFSISCVNEIKCEKLEEFESSIFSDVYKRAHDLVEHIIHTNEKLSVKDELRDYCNEKQIVNMISFLGERGMGKSSAMLSFAFYLKQYYNQQIDQQKRLSQGHPFFLRSGNEQSLFFSVLSKIDVAMMMQGESLFDVIMAKMWDEYSKLCEETHVNSDYLYHETSAKFHEVRKAYVRYKTVLNSDDKSNDIVQLNELHELSRSLNLRKSFEVLVNYYLKCVSRENSEAYLVIPLDDLDMVMENVYDKLEEVRFLLTIPRVIVLLTADVNRMALQMNSQFSQKSLCGFNVTNMEKEQIRGYVTNYLGKVLPRNMRVYMPMLKEIESAELSLDDPGIIYKLYRNSKMLEEGIELDRVYLICIALSLNIMAYPGQNSFMIRTNTLRNIVNSMNELFGIIKKRNSYDAVQAWLQKELNVGYNELNHNDYARLLYLLRERPDQYYNEAFCNFLEDRLTPASEGIGYGAVIKSLLVMRGQWPLEMVGRNLTQWTYAMAVSKAVERNDGSAERFFVKGDIFSSVIRPISSVTEGPMNIASGFKLQLEDKGNATETMESLNNVKTMWATFNALMFYNMEEIFHDIQLTKRYGSAGGADTCQYVILQSKDMNYNTSLDNLFRNAINIDEYWIEYIDAIYGVLNTTPIRKPKRDSILSAMKGASLNLSDYDRWKQYYNIASVWDLLPIQNVSVMMEIAERLKQFYNRRRAQLFNFENFLDELIGIVIDVYKETENHYDVAAMDRDKFSVAKNFSYSEKLEKLYEMGVFKNVGDKLDGIFRLGGDLEESADDQ